MTTVMCSDFCTLGLITTTLNLFTMNKTILFTFALLSILFFSCTLDKSEEESANPLEGVWELVSGEWNSEDTTYVYPDPELPDFKSMKIFTKGYFCTIHQSGPVVKFQALAGTYKITGEEYSQISLFNSSGNIGGSITMRFNIEGDILKQESDRHNEVWKRIE